MKSTRRTLTWVGLILAKKPVYQKGPTVQGFSILFSQLLQLLSRLEFDQAVKKDKLNCF
jgi:hypothetical protein